MAIIDYALCPAIIPATTLDQQAVKLFILKRAEGVSRHTAVDTLDRVARQLGYTDMIDCPWSKIDDMQWAQWVDQQLRRVEPETLNSYIGTLRGLAKRAIERHVGSADAWSAMSNIETVECDGDAPGAGRKATRRDMAALLQACGDDEKGARDRFLIRFLWATGLRIDSVARLMLENVTEIEVEEKDADGDPVLVKQWFVNLGKATRGKRRKKHRIPMDETTVAAFQEYIVVRGEWEGPLFVAATPGYAPHRLKRSPVSSSGLSDAFDKLVKAAGIEHMTCHDFRRTAITQWITVAGLRSAQLLANHSRPEQTAGYDLDGPMRMAEAVRRRPLPDALTA